VRRPSPSMLRRPFHQSLRHFASRIHDPTARRPTARCDPYGQGGKPLTRLQAEPLVGEGWSIEEVDTLVLTKSIPVVDYLTAGRIVSKLTAVAELQQHYPRHLGIARSIVRRKQWRHAVRVDLQTQVLNGLSKHDFYLAMVKSPLVLCSLFS